VDVNPRLEPLLCMTFFMNLAFSQIFYSKRLGIGLIKCAICRIRISDMTYTSYNSVGQPPQALIYLAIYQANYSIQQLLCQL
jgi:hypothetical protein